MKEHCLDAALDRRSVCRFADREILGDDLDKAQRVSLLAYSDGLYRWRDDVIRSNLALSEPE